VASPAQTNSNSNAAANETAGCDDQEGHCSVKQIHRANIDLSAIEVQQRDGTGGYKK
jgi:hypothetical protein